MTLPRLLRTDAEKVERPTGRGSSPSRHLLAALALAGVLPCMALIWPDTLPREIVVLALIAWAGIFVVAMVTRSPHR